MPWWIRTFFCLALGVALGGADGPAPAALDEEPGGAPQEIRAQLSPRDYTTIAAEIAARIDRISYRGGEHFKKGDVLAQFDCVTQRAEGAKAHAILLAAEKTYAVNKRLFELKTIGQLELEVSAADIEKAKADVAVADATIAKCQIVAPYSGAMIEQKAREFQYITPGQPLFDILDDSGLEVDFIAPSRWLRWLKPAYPFEIRVDETGRSYAGHVLRLGARVDPVSQSIKVTGTLGGDTHDLIAGMSGRIAIAPPP